MRKAIVVLLLVAGCGQTGEEITSIVTRKAKLCSSKSFHVPEFKRPLQVECSSGDPLTPVVLGISEASLASVKTLSFRGGDIKVSNGLDVKFIRFVDIDVLQWDGAKYDTGVSIRAYTRPNPFDPVPGIDFDSAPVDLTGELRSDGTVYATLFLGYGDCAPAWDGEVTACVEATW